MSDTSGSNFTPFQIPLFNDGHDATGANLGAPSLLARLLPRRVVRAHLTPLALCRFVDLSDVTVDEQEGPSNCRVNDQSAAAVKWRWSSQEAVVLKGARLEALCAVSGKPLQSA